MGFRSVIGSSLFIAFVGGLAGAEEPGLMSREFIFESALFASCHASTIVETPKGAWLAAWFGGTREGANDVGIWLARSEFGKWSAPVEVATGVQADGSRWPCWNPVLFQPATGPLLLFYKVGPSPSKWWGMLRTSADEGATWSEARRLPDGILGPIKNKPVQLSDGAILCPSSAETDTKPSQWRVHFERSGDLGATWTSVTPAARLEGKELDAIQPSILVHDTNTLQALGRTRNGKVFETASRDGGKTWSAPTLTALPNPNSGTDAVTLKDGRSLLIYNHTPLGRSPLNLALSTDGKVWQAALMLETEFGEFSYPAIVQARDGLVHAVYTWKRKRIRHVVIDPGKLVLRPIRDGAWPQ
jgi:predicted neuraminidase